jgi:hypothetical protein
MDVAVPIDAHHAAALREAADGARRRPPRADSIYLGRRALLERLVRAHMVERRQPVIAGALLRDQIWRGAVFEVKTHIDVHAFMRSVVGRTSGPASHDANP